MDFDYAEQYSFSMVVLCIFQMKMMSLYALSFDAKYVVMI